MRKGKRRLLIWVTALILLLSACERQPTWQEQYDLGMRYLSEGNYEEAIIAFTAAIEIDPKRAEAYIGRGDAYIAFEETDSALNAAIKDYQTALELDKELAEAYSKLADCFIKQGNIANALELLRKGYEMTNDESIKTTMDLLMGLGDELYEQDPFTSFRDYVPQEELSDEQLQFLENVIENVESGDIQTFFDLRGKARELFAEMRGSLYTYIAPYKLKFWSSSEYDSMEIEFRPFSGTAYMWDVSSSDIVEKEIYMMQGNVSEWQWNGVYTYTMETYWRDGDYDWQELRGEARNNFRVGEEHRSYYYDYATWGGSSTETKYYTDKDRQPLPGGIEEW